MSDLWHPRAIRVACDAGLWGTYVGGPFRGVLHTTETDGYNPSTASYYGHQSWPHSTIGIKDGRPQIWQHIPINRAARALKNLSGGVQTNNRAAVQTEIVWRAGKAKQMPPPLLDAVADWMRWVEATVGVKRYGVTFYGPDAGFTLASENARQRMSADAWNRFDGWCGHQHVPENSHWDPGAIDMGRLLGTPLTPGGFPMALSDQEQADLAQRVKNIEGVIAGLHPLVDLIDPLRSYLADPSTSNVDADAIAERIAEQLGDEVAKAVGERLVNG